MAPGVYLAPPSEEEKKKQLQQQQEQELNKLFRQYTVLDRERAQIQFSGFRKLTKSSKVVDIFKAEYQNLLTDLAIAASPAKSRSDRVQFDKLNDVLHEHDYFDEKIKVRRTYMAELDDQIKKVAKQVEALQKKQVTDRQVEENVHEANRTLEMLENKLDVEMKKFNLIVAKNAKLRTELEYILFDRRNFMNIWEKLINKMNTGKRIMLDLIEQATIAYDQREEWCNKLQMLRIAIHRDVTQNMDQIRMYEQKVNDGIKLEEFFNLKNQKRNMRDLYRKNKLKRMELKKKLEEKLHNYEEMVFDIQEFTGRNAAEVIAKKYYHREAENFMKFRKIIDLQGEMEIANDHLIDLHVDIDDRRRLHEERRQQQLAVLDNLEADLVETSMITKEAEKDVQDMDSNLDQMIQGITRLFTICRCDRNPLLQLLGDNSTIKDYNVLLYLRILDSTIQESLVRASWKIKESDKKPKIFSDEKITSKIYPITQIVTDHPCALCIEHELVSDVIDTLQKPLSKREILSVLKERCEQPGADAFIHRISKCHLPQARHLMQRRYE